jgi:hypothetical protein
MNPPRTLLNYTQESERAEKNKLKNKAIIVIKWAKGDYKKKKEEIKLI